MYGDDTAKQAIPMQKINITVCENDLMLILNFLTNNNVGTIRVNTTGNNDEFHIEYEV